MPKLLFFAICLFFIACTSEKNKKQLQAVIDGFKNSNLLVEKGNEAYLHSMEYKSKDTRNYDGAQAALEKTENVLQQAKKARQYIEQLKMQSAGTSYANVQIFDTLFKIRQTMLESIAPSHDDPLSVSRKNKITHLAKSLPLFNGLNDSTKAALISFRKSWTDSNALSSDSMMNHVILNKIENDLLITVNRIMEYCHNLIYTYTNCSGHLPIATISSSYVKTGDKIEVNVGIGEFDNSRDPKIIINNKPVQLNEEYVAVYSLKTKRPGTYKLPVRVEYTKPDGTKESVQKIFTYTVVD